MSKLFSVLSALTVAGAAFAEASVDSVSVRQDWPWSKNINVAVVVSGADTAGVDLKVEAFDGETPLGEITAAALASGSLLGAKNGTTRFAIDPSKAFADASTHAFDAFRLDVAVKGASDPLLDRVEYRIIDLETQEVKDLTRRDFYSRPDIYGDIVRDYSTVGDGFKQYIDDCFIWMGVNTDEYKTRKLALKRIPAGGVEWTMGPSQAEIDAGVAKANGFWSHPTMGEGQKRVKISKDYFLAVFELTQEQCFRLCGRKLSYYTNQTTRATSPIDYERDDEGAISPPDVPTLLDPQGKFGFKLPTEAQWEFAAKTGHDGVDLPNGKPATIVEIENKITIPNLGELEGYSKTRGHQGQNDLPTVGGPYLVGGGKPNAYGLWNMLGNVRERTRDNACINPGSHNHNSTSNPAVDPTVPGNCLSSNYYTIKGGSFLDLVTRPAARYANTGGAGFYTNVSQTGWRLVIEDVE